MKTILVTRSWDDIKIKEFTKRMIGAVDHIIVCINVKKENKVDTRALLQEMKNMTTIPIEQWGASNPLNIGFTEAIKRKADFILAISPEVNQLKKEHIDEMEKELNKDTENNLVIGYSLKSEWPKKRKWPKDCRNKDFFKKDFIKGHSSNSSEFAYRIPWNTCALWNAKLFRKYVITFNTICDVNEFDEIPVKIGKCYYCTPVEGMEDGLAIMQAYERNCKLKCFLIKRPQVWDKMEFDEHKLLGDQKKLSRKQKVLEVYRKKFDLEFPPASNVLII
ncbi:hypothetical protein KKF61_03735 [Patescibacteria group bacterium]|nr:hypothetical protein [Patescibacteria group bacterium]MBU0964428.1 hypothetical protein [Patescibacteria group bacterium]